LESGSNEIPSACLSGGKAGGDIRTKIGKPE
jgi:hypothetical protein